MLSQIAIHSRDCEVLNVKKFLSAILMLALLAALPTAALADIRRGDRGEDVKELQTLMFELGWLFEQPTQRGSAAARAKQRTPVK